MTDKHSLKSGKQLPAAILWVAITAGIVLRFVMLGGQSLWTDEIITIQTSFMGVEFPVHEFFGLLEGPLISLMIHFWGAVSMAEAFLRLPFAVAGGLTVLCIFLLARYLTDRWIALHAASVAALSPMLIWYSQEIRGYAFLLLFTVIASYYLVRFIRTGRSLYLVPYSAFLFAGCLSHLSCAFVAGAHFFYILIYHRSRASLGRWAVAIVAVMVLLLPWAHQVYMRVPLDNLAGGDVGEPLVTGARFSPMAVPYSFFAYSVGYTLGPPVRELHTNALEAVRENLHWAGLALAVFAIPVIIGIKRLARENRELLVFLLLWIVVPVAALSILSVRNIKVFTPRYAMVAIPPYAMLVGRGLAAINRSRWWPLTAAFALVVGVSIYNYFGEPRYGRDDARSAARVISENLREGDAVAAHFAAAPLAHYLGGSIEVQIFGPDDLVTPEAMAARCEEIASGSGRVWLSLCREWHLDPRGIIHGWFEANMALVEAFRFPGVRLYLYRKLPEGAGGAAGT